MGYANFTSLNVTRLTHECVAFGGTEPIEAPTPKLTVTFSTWMSWEQPSLARMLSLRDGLIAIASSQLVILMFFIVMLEP